MRVMNPMQARVSEREMTGRKDSRWGRTRAGGHRVVILCRRGLSFWHVVFSGVVRMGGIACVVCVRV
jgi:hypothetical protein